MQCYIVTFYFSAELENLNGSLLELLKWLKLIYVLASLAEIM